MMVPKARVTMARYGPVTRRAGKARMAPKTAAPTMLAGMASQNDRPSLNTSTPVAYEPMPNRPAWPSDTCPV